MQMLSDTLNTVQERNLCSKVEKYLMRSYLALKSLPSFPDYPSCTLQECEVIYTQGIKFPVLTALVLK